jgi:DNA-binding NarL/FixJ family response regulator
VLIVEDHEMLAEALASALRVTGADTHVVRAATADDVVDAVTGHRPRLVLLDLDLGLADLTGDLLVPSLVDAGATVILLTGCRDRTTLGRCLEAGAVGVVSKEAGLTVLIDAVDRVLRGEPLPDRDEREAMIAEARERRAADAQRLAPFLQLTRREAHVLRALADGRSVESVAAESFVSVATVRSQVRAILMKLGVGSQLAAVAAARRSGWLDARPNRAA